MSVELFLFRRKTDSSCYLVNPSGRTTYDITGAGWFRHLPRKDIVDLGADYEKVSYHQFCEEISVRVAAANDALRQLTELRMLPKVRDELKQYLERIDQLHVRHDDTVNWVLTKEYKLNISSRQATCIRVDTERGSETAKAVRQLLSKFHRLQAYREALESAQINELHTVFYLYEISALFEESSASGGLPSWFAYAIQANLIGVSPFEEHRDALVAFQIYFK